MMRSILLLNVCSYLVCTYLSVLPTHGQDRQGTVSSSVQTDPVSHADLLALLVVECLDAPLEARDTPAAAINLGWSGPLSFLETPVSAELMARDVPLGGPGAAALAIRMERGVVTYARAGRGRLVRSGDVSIQYTLTQPDGRILAADSCARSASDSLTKEQAESLRDARYDVTMPDIPPSGFWRRYLEPAVLVAATGIGTYLLFNLRSRRTDSG